MARPKGSKNKAKEMAGNPDFNLNQVEPSNTMSDIAPGALMPEDLEFDRHLEAIEAMPFIDDPEPAGSVVKIVKDQPELLRHAIGEEYKPATRPEELREQIHMAKVNGCDSIEASKDLCSYMCRDKSYETVGYFIYHDIKVYLDGQFEKAQARDKRRIGYDSPNGAA